MAFHSAAACTCSLLRSMPAGIMAIFRRIQSMQLAWGFRPAGKDVHAIPLCRTLVTKTPAAHKDVSSPYGHEAKLSWEVGALAVALSALKREPLPATGCSEMSTAAAETTRGNAAVSKKIPRGPQVSMRLPEKYALATPPRAAEAQHSDCSEPAVPYGQTCHLSRQIGMSKR